MCFVMVTIVKYLASIPGETIMIFVVIQEFLLDILTDQFRRLFNNHSISWRKAQICFLNEVRKFLN